jgi:hypothetical protein
MGKSIRDNTKSRGRPKTTGTGLLIGVRLQTEQLGHVDAWRGAQSERPGRPEAIRQLLDVALASSKRLSPSPDAAKKALKLASKTAEDLTDRSAPVEEQQRRKRRLIRGPSEFRGIRKDQPKR